MITKATLLRRLRQKEPEDIVGALIDLGITTTYVGEGAYRDVYSVEGLPVVLKFPKDEISSLDHCRQEWKAYNTILKNPKYRSVRKYLPRFFDFNERTGVALVERYRPVDRRKDTLKKYEKAVSDIYKILKRGYSFDESYWNFGKDEAGNIRIIDMGLLQGFIS